jgi:gliding motility-associated-like protein
MSNLAKKNRESHWANIFFYLAAMKTIILSFFLLVFLQSSFAQYLPPDNLVLNPDFKNYTYSQVVNAGDFCVLPQLVCGYKNETSNLFHSLCLHNWISPNTTTPEFIFLDSCNFDEFPYKLFDNAGVGLVNIYTEYADSIYTNHEYLQGMFIQPLIQNHRYCVSVFVIFYHYRDIATEFFGSNVFFVSSIGAYFSKDKIQRNDKHAFYEYYPPQIQNPLGEYLTDSTNWMLVSGSFVADGDEEYITIGNFLPDTLTPYMQFQENNTVYVGKAVYLIGFVGVYDCTGHDYQCNAGEDMRICNGQVVQLGTDDDSRRQYRWSPAVGLSDSTAAKPLASPTETTTYYLYVIDEFVQESYDTVTVEVIYCDIFIPNIFSPNGDGQNDVLYVRGQGIEQLSFVVYNRWGQKVFETKDPNHGWDGTINGKPAETGVYVYHVNAVLHDGLVVSRHGDVTLVR